MRRILIADDDPDVRESLRLLFELQGYSVDEARNGQEALHRLNSNGPPCLIVLDLMMPIMDGWQFRRIQREDPVLGSVPVLVISAVPAHLQRTTELAAHRVFAKPFDYDALLAEAETICAAPGSSAVGS